MWSLRFTDYALYVAAGCTLYALCRRVARLAAGAGRDGGWLYLAHHPSFNIAGFYTEEYVASSPSSRWRRRRATPSAAAPGRRWPAAWPAATAVLFKHPAVACGVPILVLDRARRPLRAVALVAVVGALPLAAVVGYFWWHGALAALLDCQVIQLMAQQGILQPVPLSARLSELAVRTRAQLAPYPVVLYGGGLGAAVCLLRPTRARLAAALWLLADLLLIAAQKFYYEHYFIQLFPSALLCAAYGAAWLVERRRGERWWVTAPRWAVAVAAGLLAWPSVAAVIAQRRETVDLAWAQLRSGPAAWPHAPGGPFEAELGRYLRDRTAADDRIYIFETGTALAAYWTAERLPASRYFFSITVQSSLARTQEMIGELERTQPVYVVITGGPGERPLLSPYLRAHYTLAAERWGPYRIEIWARLDRLPFAAGTSEGLAADARRGGLVLDAAGAAPRRGRWISPPLEVLGEPDELTVDWQPRPAPMAAGVGMGVAVRYRTGPTPDLTEQPWVAVEQGEGRRVVQAQRYMQIQCELWSDDGADGPVLQSLQAGRVRFELGGTAPAGPLRTAACGAAPRG